MKDTIQQLIEDKANEYCQCGYSCDTKDGFKDGATLILEEHNQINKEMLEALKK